MSQTKTLRLHLTFEYFDQIKAGTKTEEYRLVDKWRKKVEGREYDNLLLLRAYPSRDDMESRLLLPYPGYTRQVITHPHFGDKPVDVYAFDVLVCK